ncbi:MAG TPA: hypothetical protein PKZ60_06475 [Candidatus Saccharicenans sp.]|nr:hypothetical protein [Candidatus Saccharicenans sp.]HPU92992.1 hypothetical protein [Candidatus Saccharicenans sp.]
MSKKFKIAFALLLLLFFMLSTSSLILASKPHCDEAYVVCLRVAGNNTAALDDCLRGWAACEGIPIDY